MLLYSYYRCSRYKYHCAGRCVIEGGRIRNIVDHNHPPEPDRVLVDRFRKTLTQRAATEKGELYAIYWEEATLRHSEAALLYTFMQAESAMRKARRKQLPVAPKTITELGDILSTTELFQIHAGSKKEPFYHSTIMNDNTTCVLLMHTRTINIIGKIEDLHIDCSTFVHPQLSEGCYIFTIHSIQAYEGCPILYAITTKRDQSILSSIFQFLREQFPNIIIPNCIVTEFDTEMQTSLGYTFPEATIKSNWFHYAESVQKQMVQLGLEKETVKGHGMSALKMLMVLPFLPAEYITPGFKSLKKWMTEKLVLTAGMVELCNYVENNWLRCVSAEKMSIFGISNGTNNHVHNFNKELRESISTQNITLWNILEILTSTATKYYIKSSKKIKSGPSPSKPPTRKSRIVIETIINNATQLWIRTAVHLRNPLQFLQLCCHCIQDPKIFQSTEDPKAQIKHNYALPVSNRIETTTNYIQIIENQLVDDNFLLQHFQTYQSGNLHITPTTHEAIQINANLLTDNQPIAISSEPPPLAYFPKAKIAAIKQTNSEPPPLVPIRSRFR